MRFLVTFVSAVLIASSALADENPLVEGAKNAARATGKMWAAAPVCHLRIDEAKLDNFLSLVDLDTTQVHSTFSSFAQEGASDFAKSVSQTGVQEACFKIYDDFGPLRLNVMHRNGPDAP